MMLYHKLGHDGTTCGAKFTISYEHKEKDTDKNENESVSLEEKSEAKQADETTRPKIGSKVMRAAATTTTATSSKRGTATLQNIKEKGNGFSYSFPISQTIKALTALSVGALSVYLIVKWRK